MVIGPAQLMGKNLKAMAKSLKIFGGVERMNPLVHLRELTRFQNSSFKIRQMKCLWKIC